jgi:hypothetical protein
MRNCWSPMRKWVLGSSKIDPSVTCVQNSPLHVGALLFGSTSSASSCVRLAGDAPGIPDLEESTSAVVPGHLLYFPSQSASAFITSSRCSQSAGK